MQYFVFLASILLVPMVLTLIDRRIKGARSVLVKLLSVIAVMSFLFISVYFYGQQILATFKVNVKSFTNIKAFFNSRVLVLLCLLLFILFIACKFVFTVLIFKSLNKETTKLEKTLTLVSIVFDLALIPNIFVNNALFTVFAMVTLVEIGLVYTKLVFSIAQNQRKEVLA